MIRHVLKLVWNRRRASRLVVIEIAAAFVVTFVLAALAMNLWSNHRRPLGFDYENVWSVTATDTTVSGGPGFFAPGTSHSETLTDVLEALRALPRTEAVEPIQMTVFLDWRLQFVYAADGDGQIVARYNRTTAGGLRMLGVTLVDGRLFGPEDEGQDYRAVLVNRRFVDQAFRSGQDVVGRRIDRPIPDFPYEQLTEEQRRQALREVRIVGVIDDFRQWGEFADPVPYVIRGTSRPTSREPR
jgi:putative ABC transport system permease protein